MSEPKQQEVSISADAGGEVDAHGFDPADYKWVPVARKPRKDGWTPQRQVDFIAALADTGCVERAARLVSMTVGSCYRLRRSPGAEPFARAWDAAMAQAARRLVDLAFDRAVNGSAEPVFDKDGHRIGRRMRYNDRLLMFLLRAYMPERFRHAHRATILPGEELPALPEPVAQAMLRLEPVAPAEPHLLMPPGELDMELECADLGDGMLPHWYRGRGELEPDSQPQFADRFEALLAAAKGESWPPPDPASRDDGDSVLD